MIKKTSSKQEPQKPAIKVETMNELVGLLDKYSLKAEMEDSKRVFDDEWRKD